MNIFLKLSFVFINKISDKLTYGKVKHALTVVMRKFFTNNFNFDNNSFLVLGFNGFQPEVADSYSNPGSTYFTLIPFIILGLPHDHPFWISQLEDFTQMNAFNNKSFCNDKFGII